MATERKIEQVALLEERLRRSRAVIGLDYRGLSVGQMQALRRAVRAEAPETELRVVKNTLWRRAAEQAEMPEAAGLAQEATALLFGFGEVPEAPRALQAHLRQANLELPLHGVFVEGALEPPERVKDLAEIPSRPELMAKLAGGLNSPIGGIAGSLNAVIRDVAAIVEAYAAQLEESGGAAAEDAAPTDVESGKAVEAETETEAEAGGEPESDEPETE